MNHNDDDVNKEQLANHYMDSAVRQLRRGRPSLALEILERAAEVGIPVRDLQFIRSLCLCQLHHLFEAREALQEELLNFPENELARGLLNEVEQDCERIRQQMGATSQEASIDSETAQSTQEPKQRLKDQIERSIESNPVVEGEERSPLGSTIWIGENLNRLR